MAQENVTRFEELLRGNEELQAKLAELEADYKRRVSSPRAVFEAVVAPLAEEVGLPFSFEEATGLIPTDRELCDEELDAVAGGGCFIFGGSDGAEAECEATGYACYYFGVTID